MGGLGGLEEAPGGPGGGSGEARGGVREGLGRSRGGLGGVLGGLGAILKRFYEQTDLSSNFGSILACMKFRLGVQDDPKTAPKTTKNRSQNEVEI